jgi:hypothetical protein
MDDTPRLRQSRMRMFERVATGLLAKYDEIRDAELDSGLTGAAGENIVTEWMRTWLPTRIGLRNGAIVSMNREPTTQRDCVLFDQAETPTYRQFGDVDLLPIEGVLGDVELNYGEHTGYTKVLTDAAKLTDIGLMARDSFRRMAVAYSHLPMNVNPVTATREQVISGLVNHQGFPVKPILLVFAEQLEGNLQECARRVMEHNKAVGVRASVDGIFVLKQGYALHPASDRKGWNTTRQPGDAFACLETTASEVLLRLQSVTLRHLAIAGRIHPGGFDHYLSVTEQGEREVAASMLVSDDNYIAQPDDPGYVGAKA